MQINPPRSKCLGMTQLPEQAQLQQQQLQEQQRNAKEWTTDLIECLGERRLNYDNVGMNSGPTRGSNHNREGGTSGAVQRVSEDITEGVEVFQWIPSAQGSNG